MKTARLLLTAALVAAALSSTLSALPPRAAAGRGADPYAQLARLFRERRYFELRDAVALMDGLSGPAPEFYRGAVDLAFNRLDSAVSMDERQIPVRIRNRVFYFSYDTGANLSILFGTAADQLGLVRRGPKTTIQSSTGKWIEARLTVVPELRLGEAVVRNAVFLVMPDEFFPGRRVRPGVECRGILGAPLLAGLGEFSETRDGRFIIPAAPPARPESNLCFFGFMPLTEVVYHGARLLFILDTGASSTVLHPPFYRRYGAGLQDRSPLTALTMGGVGDLRRINVHILEEFSFRASGRGLSLRKVAVQTQVTNALTDCFCGTLGLDILDQCSRLTVNFASMSFILE